MRAAIGLAISAGFGLGAALFAASAMAWPVGAWWPAAAQAHGHVQLFGWGGLLVLGVGFHFLPRLRGVPDPEGWGVRAVLRLLVCGLVLRACCQPVLGAVTEPAIAHILLRLGLLVSGILELAAATVVLWTLGQVLRRGSPLRSRTRLWPLLPFFGTAFMALWLALAVNLVGLIDAAGASALLPGWADSLSRQLAMFGFLLPIAVAMSERTFPLFYRTQHPHLPTLRAGLLLLMAGLCCRFVGDLTYDDTIAGFGTLCTALACALFVVALGIFMPRRPLPRQRVRPYADPLQLHAISAYTWLVLVAVVLALDGVRLLGPRVPAPGPDAEIHAFGAGFMTLLILGVGAHLLPGFANRPLRHRSLPWLTLVLGNLAALLRVGPLFLTALAPGAAATAQAFAGVAAPGAIGIFAWNVPNRLRPKSATPREGTDARLSGGPTRKL